MTEEFLNISAESSEFDNEEIDSPQSSHGSAEGSSSENSNSQNEDMPVMERPKRPTRTWNRKRKHSTESEASNFDDEIRDKDFVLNSSENDSSTDSCTNKGDKSSHVTDEGESLPEESAHIDAQNIASEASRNAEMGDNHTESDNQSETVNIDSTDNSSEEMDIDVTTKLFVKKLKKYGISQRQAAKLILKCSQSNLSEAITKAKRLKTSKSVSTRGMFIYKQMEKWLCDHSAQRSTAQKNGYVIILPREAQHRKMVM
jgi:hypothetical protein